MRKEGWSKLGEGRVEGTKDLVAIPVAEDAGPFAVIMLKAENSRLDLFDLTVVFDDGTAFRPNTRLHFMEGKTSRPLNLPGHRRIIRHVEFRAGKGVSQDFRAGILEVWAR